MAGEDGEPLSGRGPWQKRLRGDADTAGAASYSPDLLDVMEFVAPHVPRNVLIWVVRLVCKTFRVFPQAPGVRSSFLEPFPKHAFQWFCDHLQHGYPHIECLTRWERLKLFALVAASGVISNVGKLCSYGFFHHSDQQHSPDSLGCHPCLAAALAGKVDVVHFMLECDYPVQPRMLLEAAAEHWSLPEVERLLETPQLRKFDLQSHDGLLVAAAKSTTADAAAKVDWALNVCDGRSKKAVSAAAGRGDRALVDRLRDEGCKLDVPDALDAVAETGNPALLDWLLEEYERAHPVPEGGYDLEESPLHNSVASALGCGHTNVARLLLPRYIAEMPDVDQEGLQDQLEWDAGRSGSVEVMALVQQHTGCPFEVWQAVWRGRTEPVLWAISQQVDDDWRTWNVMDEALDSRHCTKELLALLREKDVPWCDITTALHVAYGGGCRLGASAEELLLEMERLDCDMAWPQGEEAPQYDQMCVDLSLLRCIRRWGWPVEVERLFMGSARSGCVAAMREVLKLGQVGADTLREALKEIQRDGDDMTRRAILGMMVMV